LLNSCRPGLLIVCRDGIVRRLQAGGGVRHGPCRRKLNDLGSNRRNFADCRRQCEFSFSACGGLCVLPSVEYQRNHPDAECDENDRADNAFLDL
jgi:hypothetical protein